MALTINTWANGWAADCATDQDLVAIPADQDCIQPPNLSQICDLFITPINDPAADEPFTWTDGVPSVNAGGIDNTDAANTKSKQITGKGGIAVPEISEYLGPKRIRVVKERTYRLEFEVSVKEASMRELVRQLQSGWTEFKFWYATLGGQLFGPEAAIRPSYVDGQLPLDSADDGNELGTIIIEFISTAGDPIRNVNPLA